jgi:hypothetical protein
MTQYLVKFFKYNFFILSLGKNYGWIRIFGRGFAWKHIEKGLSFSERMGCCKVYRIRNYYFTKLRCLK